MGNRIAQIGIIVESSDSVEKMNALLHEYGEYIIGRMGIPYAKRKISIISIVVDAPQDMISALSGKLGMLPDVNTKTLYSKVTTDLPE
ncbi:MAG TPA: iron-only hydrogenase system regulator [Ruminiclostridium sp.]|nr:iron-only hydrogenase system regulator [Ruminiclostridium sp.]